jgi:CDP-diacylglycerol--serine O-phosphatidyltransferase
MTQENSSLLPKKHHPFVDELVEQDQQKPAIGIYILPNLFTTAALFGGFYAIVASIRGLFEIAAIVIFIAMILDSLDGRIARLTNTQSAFGAEYDSLSDMVAFAVAPSILVYEWSLQYLGKIGWVGAFIFVAAVALRLARFNSQQENQDKRYFTGLPCPAGAGVIASLVWVGATMRAGDLLPSILIGLLTIGVGIAMISNMKYRSFKDLDLKNRVPFVNILFVILVFVCLALKPDIVLFIAFFGYAISGVWTWIREHFSKSEDAPVQEQSEQ